MRKLLAPYFLLEGRSSRREWWIIEILIVLGFRLNEALFDAMARGSGRFDLGGEAGQTWMLIGVVLLWLNIASNVRRLHDRGKSGWWSLIYAIPGIGQLWCFIECGFLKGQPHANRYGPPTGSASIYQSLVGQMMARLPALNATAMTPSHAPKTIRSSVPAVPRADPQAALAKATRRVPVLAATQRPTVQRRTVRRGGRLPMPSDRVAIALAVLILGLVAMALTTGIPIPTGVAPVGANPDVPEQP
jgi:uncharacterized membrane protein YhaH (DUF805 family)